MGGGCVECVRCQEWARFIALSVVFATVFTMASDAGSGVVFEAGSGGVHMVVRRGLPGSRKSKPLLDVSGSLVEVADQLAPRVSDHESGCDWVTVVFDDVLTVEEQQLVGERLRAACEQAEWETLHYSLSSDVLVVLAVEADEQGCVGLWADERTLLVGRFDVFEGPSGIAKVSARHWHPGSRTSGSFGDVLVVLTSTLAVSLKFLDENGVRAYVRRVDASSPKRIAELFAAEADGWELTGRGVHLLGAYVLGFDGGDTGLVGADYAGYEVESLNVYADKLVMAELEKMFPRPSPAEAADWLGTARSLCEWFDEDHPLVVELSEIAGTAAD